MEVKRKSYLIIIFVLIFINFKDFTAYAGEVRGVTDTTIKVGIIGDLTGPIATTWQPALRSIRTCLRHINESGGIHGRKIINVVEDDRYSIPMALAAFKKIVFRDQVLLFIGASGVGHTHSVIPLAEKNKVPMIAATNDITYFNPVRRHIFTPIPFYEDQIELIYEYIFKDLKATDPTIALAYPDTASGHISRDTCRNMCKEHNSEKYIETIISVGAGDFTSQILHLKRQKPDYVLIHGYVSNTSALLRDAYKMKFKSTFIAIQYASVDDTIKLAGVSARGLIGTNAFSGWNDKSLGIGKIRRMVTKYQGKTRFENRTYLNGWLMVELIHRGLENAGRGLNPEAFVEGLERIRHFDSEGICGIISFGPNDHKSLDYSRFYKADVDKKQFVPITGWRKPQK